MVEACVKCHVGCQQIMGQLVSLLKCSQTWGVLKIGCSLGRGWWSGIMTDCRAQSCDDTWVPWQGGRSANALFCASGLWAFFLALFAFFCASLHPLSPQSVFFFFVPCVGKFKCVVTARGAVHVRSWCVTRGNALLTGTYPAVTHETRERPLCLRWPTGLWHILMLSLLAALSSGTSTSRSAFSILPIWVRCAILCRISRNCIFPWEMGLFKMSGTSIAGWRTLPLIALRLGCINEDVEGRFNAV